MSATISAPRRRSHAVALDSPNAGFAAGLMVPPPTPPSMPTTPRSTLGSPLCTHATRRSGSGDLAAGPRRRNSLSEVEVLPWLCCMAPALSLFGIYISIIVTSLFFPRIFYILTACLTFIVLLWIANLAFSSMLGAYRLREGTRIDWHALLEQLQNDDPTANDVLHIVLLPNFKENERMLKETLENLGCSPMARGRTRVVLAMEAREGQAAREKAERLISQTSHLFADIFATFHPENVPGEVAGKSSNTQWAYREALRQYGPILLGCDLSRVFLTVGDADTHWHPQYLSAMTYQGLTMSGEDRAWRIWQPPVLLMRNIFTVPAMTRASAHATLIFELSSLANQKVFPAFAYSAYSLTLALASHPEVDGWDVDVIAEDHHMYCKCYFASLWEQAHAVKTAKEHDQIPPITPQLCVQPIFLPAVSFLVESSDGYLASCIARFHQARRHMQGIVELGYVLLQYTRLVKHTGFGGLPVMTHAQVCAIAFKMHTLHITTTAQCFALIMAALTKIIPAVVGFLLSGGLMALMQEQASGIVAQAWASWGSLDAAQQTMAASMGNISGVVVLYSITCFVVVLDVIEGRYYEVMGHPTHEINPVAEGDETTADSLQRQEDEDEKRKDGKPSFVVGRQSFFARASLLLSIFNDTAFVGYAAITIYALIPAVMAAWSLIRRGTDFEYIVAEKPE
eukprot:CAMPEP_0203887292 /NCGR_PEP_ID=MMETSP0359-20131031/31017_1 /ASSEMBLY_ACC=CAM_ASM_000338 /TAXON_ID=268821 /ORGANISM="Scrippsiella Hangoei, Strain SHTV-5" /LENGTH=682 /DNA_ID=CAMNT_0050808281 /DNA_START=40 /DNA_END=2088 /DNA_ORIENTATION=-